jgi:hypothetical protein
MLLLHFTLSQDITGTDLQVCFHSSFYATLSANVTNIYPVTAFRAYYIWVRQVYWCSPNPMIPIDRGEGYQSY